MKALALGRILLLFCPLGLGGWLMAGCQALGGGEALATTGADLTMVASESLSIRVAATAERIALVETVVAAGARIARVSAVNAVLGATLRARQTGTPAVRAVVVSAEDMGSSLEDDMMAGEAGPAGPQTAMSVSDLSTAASTEPESGCSSGAVTVFSPNARSIFVTALVSALRSGALFEVEWRSEAGALYKASWLADYSKSFECVWFYATPSDFPFAPGRYAATMYVDGAALGTTEFTISDNDNG